MTIGAARGAPTARAVTVWPWEVRPTEVRPAEIHPTEVWKFALRRFVLLGSVPLSLAPLRSAPLRSVGPPRGGTPRGGCTTVGLFHVVRMSVHMSNTLVYKPSSSGDLTPAARRAKINALWQTQPTQCCPTTTSRMAAGPPSTPGSPLGRPPAKRLGPPGGPGGLRWLTRPRTGPR